MLIGHYGPAFMIKAIDKKVPLWMLFIAVQIPDIIWATLILLGVEKQVLIPIWQPIRWILVICLILTVCCLLLFIV